ncbi:MAG: ubiquinone/menaquinone biosynthesis methyltransferase [Myxococcales bacterium]
MNVQHSAEPEKVQALFTKIAGGYDRFNGIASWGLDRAWRKRAVRLAAISEGARVLDLAAGTGDLTAALAQQAKPGLVVSSDFTAAMLIGGKKKIDRIDDAAARQRITFSIADATRLPFADASFDAVTVSFGLRNFADRPANYAEVKRVLKPGGRYVVLELHPPRLRALQARLLALRPQDPARLRSAHRRRPGGVRVPAQLHPGLPRCAGARRGAECGRVRQGRVREAVDGYRGHPRRHQIGVVPASTRFHAGPPPESFVCGAAG